MEQEAEDERWRSIYDRQPAPKQALAKLTNWMGFGRSFYEHDMPSMIPSILLFLHANSQWFLPIGTLFYDTRYKLKYNISHCLIPHIIILKFELLVMTHAYRTWWFCWRHLYVSTPPALILSLAFIFEMSFVIGIPYRPQW